MILPCFVEIKAVHLFDKMMKTILISILLIFSLQTTFGQKWCAPGAKWTYGTSCGGTCSGIIELTYSGDTVINSINCKKLKKTRDGQYFIPFGLFHDDLGIEITYEQDSVVYIRSNNSFDTLYNFKASIGDSWGMVRPCDSTSNITVLDTGTIIINTIHLKFLAVNLHFNNGNFPPDYTDTIIEKVGFIGSYYIASDFCGAPLDVAEGGRFKCYNDHNFNTFKAYWSASCTFPVGINEIEKEIPIRIYPSPARDFITISTSSTFNKIKSIEFYNSFGQLILVSKQTNNIDIREIPSGLYFIKVINSEGLTQISKFLKL